jgi:hypothetical protein
MNNKLKACFEILKSYGKKEEEDVGNKSKTIYHKHPLIHGSNWSMNIPARTT